MLRAGVIGLGSMGKNHARVYADIDNVKLAAVADSDIKALKAISAKYKVKAYKDYKDMLKEKIDLISVVVPTKLHMKVALDVINSNKNLLLEKPIASTKLEAEKIIEAARKKNVKLMIGHIERFNPAIAELKKRLPQLGDIYKINVDRCGPFPSRITDVGVVIDLSVHDIDIINYLLEAKPLKIFAETQKRLHPDYEDTLTAVIKYPSSIIAVLNIDWLTPTKKRVLTVTGRRGMYKVNYLTQDIYFYENRASSTYDYGFMTVSEGNMTKIQIDKKEPLRLEIESFLNSIKTDSQPHITGEDGLSALMFAHKILDAAK
jgi:predicted dehydrogenase